MQAFTSKVAQMLCHLTAPVFVLLMIETRTEGYLNLTDSDNAPPLLW